tara:strand:+ start:17002 stop:17151 length:150 start_codon:yes stop_codon:yes gene_type:complete
MSKQDALNILSELAFRAELPKGLNGNDAKAYIEQINNAIIVLQSIIEKS